MRLEVWFNTKVPTSQVPNAEPIVPGPILRLATVEDMERCTFSTHFKVPHVGPGRYRITVFVFHQGGYGWYFARPRSQRSVVLHHMSGNWPGPSAPEDSRAGSYRRRSDPRL